MNELIKKYAEQISKISGITTIGDIELQLHHFQDELSKQSNSNLLDKIEKELENDIEWGNWEIFDEEQQMNVGFFTVPQVLRNKVEWLEEYLNEFIDEDSEYLETIDQVKRLLTILTILRNGTNK